ncbi:MAG: hypothetical protein NC548_33755 [Lachnospiraceae bacterium]|nr:hypothetical protein [Lachnospiraceae bacterium]
MDKENIDIKTAIQIAKIVVSVPEERMPIIWDIFSQAGLDIGGLDEMAEWKALTKQAFLIDTEQFLTGITKDREPVNGEYQIPVGDFNEYCSKQKLSARCTRKHLAGLEAIRTSKLSNGHIDYTISVFKPGTNSAHRCVCIYSDWQQRIKKAEGQQ